MHQIAEKETHLAKTAPAPSAARMREIMGFPVLAATRQDAIVAMDDHLDETKPALITFLNAHVSNVTAQNAMLGDVLRRSLILNDGVGVGIASVVLHGKSFPDNLNGTDLIPQFLRDSRHRFRIYAVGGIPGVAERAMEVFRKIAPQHSYVGTHHGYIDDAQSETVLADIAAKQADLVIVAMGSPRQEIWAAKHLMKTGGVSAICVGGLLDFVSQEKPRAPVWVRTLRSEWMFRLANEPRRLWRRYLIGNAVFMFRLGAAYIRS
ncbi:MAG: WecB/TagA/CpsF family glycosyltransferase [Bradyrhizobiaceae bacterium]|nr:MAG: WecB/TagA/CpsF family glycosyltransferase [Bradyrhizobiaceae bacterium]